MRTIIAVVTLFVLMLPTLAGEAPDKIFFSGNDIYQWCQQGKAMAQAYVGGMYDTAVHGVYIINSMRNYSKDMPKNDVEVDFARDRVLGFCKPKHATLEQMTDVFCAYLRDSPAKRDGLPSIMFNDALKQAWRCPVK
jgi:hypothetical protein